MASFDFENTAKFQQQFANTWNNDFGLIALLRTCQIMFHKSYVHNLTSDVINEVVRSLRKIIREKPIENTNLESEKNQVRQIALSILASDNDKLEKLEIDNKSALPQELLRILSVDNYQNTEIALSILCLPVYSGRIINPINEITQQLNDFVHSTIQDVHQVFNFFFQDQNQIQPANIIDPSLQVISKMKIMQSLRKLIITRYENGDKILLRTAVEFGWIQLSQFPHDKFLQAVKNRRILKSYFQNVAMELLALVEFGRQEGITNVEISQGQIADIQLRILQNLPPGTETLRLQILRDIEKSLASDNNRNFTGVGIVPIEQSTEADGSRTLQNQIHQPINPQTPLIDILGSQHLESVIDSSRMQGRGRPQAEVQLTHAAILRALGQKKVPFTSNQIQRIVRIICRSFLDNAVPLSQKSTLIFYLHGINLEYGRRRDRLPRGVQFEILASLAELCKIIRPQIEISIKQLRLQENKNKESENCQQYVERIKYDLAEKSLLQPSKPNSQSNVQTQLCFQYKSSGINLRAGDSIEAQRVAYSKVMWNCIASADLVFTIAREQRQNIEGGSGTFLEPNELKIVKKLLIHGSEVIQGISELGHSNEGTRTVRFFADFFRRVRPLQLRDILNDVGQQLFARVIVAKTQQYLRFSQKNSSVNQNNSPNQTQYDDQGIVGLILGDFSSFTSNRQAMEDEHVCTFLECAFEFVSNRLTKLSEPESLGPSQNQETPLENELSSLPKAELQEALVDLALLVGDQALKRPNDIRAKHIFFSVFVFCVKQAKTGALVADHYFVIIIRLFRDLCTAEHEGLVKEFLPMIQGLLETFLQSRDYVPYIEVTNHIFECVPAKLKSLLDYLPVISKPVVESMRTVAHRDLERPLNTLQLWVSGLGQFPEILDPAISHVLPELTGMLYKILYQLPNFPFKLLGKLGAKSRPYWQDQEVSTRRFSEGGLKLKLKDRHSGREVVLGIDAAIEVVLVKIFENPRAYSLGRLLDAFKLVKAALLCYIDSDVDIDYLIARVISAKSQGPQQVEQEIIEAAKVFDSSRRHNHGSFLARGSEAHAFEKILRSLLFACSLPEDNPDTLKVGKKVLKFMKWVTQYFTLVYICKDGQLLQSREDEVNPLKFLETISAFLLYNLRPGSSGPQQSSYFEGTVVCLETMLKLLNDLFGDTPEVLSNLEIVGILIKKVCHLAYEPDLRKKLAITFALPTVIRELPALAIKRHSEHILDSLSQILHTGCELSLPAAYSEYENTLELLFQKIGIFGQEALSSSNQEDQDLYLILIGKVFSNLYSLKPTAREIATSLIEKIASRANISVAALSERVPFAQNISWRSKIWTEIEVQASKILNCYRGGYTRLQKLIAYADSLRFCLRHRIAQGSIEQKAYTLLGISELLLKILEIEAHEFDESQRRPEPDTSPRRSPGVESPSSCAQKYMRLERLYISQNQEYDPYSHTQHPHELLSTQHFEVSYQAKREKEKRPDDTLASCSYRILEIFQIDGSFDRINQQAIEPLPELERIRQKAEVENRLAAFLNDIFSGPGMGQRPSDINYDYVSQLYILYPNVQLHTELICKCLEVLCDIVTHPGLDHYLQERQQTYYAPQPNSENGLNLENQTKRGERNDRQGQSKLETKLDFYAVEIKSKIIAIYFKYFQREEDNIIGTTKACLERLLSEAYQPAEALPNRILKEGVRPALNVLSQPSNSPRAFKHLTMLIEVLHGCFNDQLAQHLLAACQRRQSAVLAPYIAPEIPVLNARPPDGVGQLGHQIIPPELDPNSTLEQERRVVAQYNLEKVGSLETAKHIFQILHLLPNARERVLRAISSITKFELQASRELETSHVPPPHGTGQNCLELRPLRVKFGVLQSDFRDGLAKFFNRNPVDCVLKLSEPTMVPLMLQILKMPGSFTARERIARDLDITIRQRIRQPIKGDPLENQGQDQSNSLLAVKLIWILTKNNPNFLCQPQHSDILENLRWKWVSLYELSIESCERNGYETNEAIQRIKSIHRKIMKCLLAYCRSESSDKQVLFDLLKGFSYNSIIDLSPLLRFFTQEVPQFSRRRLQGIIETALTKVESSRGYHEQRYAMFEFAFMPLAISCLDQQDRFEDLFPPQIIFLFLKTFFQFGNSQQRHSSIVKWKLIQGFLEGSSQICYESFHVELIKVICIIFSQVQDIERLRACFIPFNKFILQILKFLKENSEKGEESNTREWSNYALSIICLKALNLKNITINEINNGISYHTQQLCNVTQEDLDLFLSEIYKSTQFLWQKIFRISFKQINNKQMIQQTLKNLINFRENCTEIFNESQQQQNINFSEIFEQEQRENLSDSDFCRMVILNAEQLYFYSFQLKPLLCYIIRSSQQNQNIQNCELIIKSALAIINWSKQDIQKDIELEQKIFKLVTKSLVQLVQVNIFQNIKYKDCQLKDIEILLFDILYALRQMILMHSEGLLQQVLISQDQFEWLDKPIQIRIFELNLSYIIVKNGNIHNDFKLLEYSFHSLNHFKSGDAKCILLAVSICQQSIKRLLDQDMIDGKFIQYFFTKICDLINYDLEIAKNRVFDSQSLQGGDRQDNQRNFENESQTNQQRRWDRQALIEAEEISRSIPHFSVRIAKTLDQLASQTQKGSAIRQLREKLLDFQFCKNLVSVLLRVVGKARRTIVTERPTYTSNDQQQQSNQDGNDLNGIYFNQDIIDWQKFEPELDHFNKETVMNGLQFLAKRIYSFKDDEAAQILENLQWLPVALAQFRSCDYITEQVDLLIGILTKEEPDQVRYLQSDKQQALVQRLLERLSESQDRRPDRKKDTPAKMKLQNKLFESCISSLEKQSSIQTDYGNRLMENLLISSRGRSVALKQRLFTVFEKCHGQSIFQKLKFFFSAHQSESPGRVANLFVISQLLDFTMMNFRQDAKLQKLPHSAKLHRLQCPHILIEKLQLEDQPQQNNDDFRSSIIEFASKQSKYTKMKLSDLLDPLSEVISINPTYHDDKPIADILFTEIFWQLWGILTRQEQLYIGECICKMFLNAIKHSQTLQQLLKPSTTFARTMLESVAALNPQIRLPPELLQFMAKQLNLWHVAIPILENHIVLNPKNERYVMALGEIYNRLHEEDYLAGLRRSITESEETRTIVTLGQHGKWEAINQLFAQYITFYAEQEGLYAHLDRHQDWPGKYSRQIPRQFLLQKFESSEFASNGQLNQELDQQQRNQRQKMIEDKYKELYERPVQDQVQQEHFPREGPNNKVSELDLRVWETLFIESLKVLNKWEQFRDIAHLHGNGDPGGAGDQSPGAHEMWIEFFWQKKDWENLGKYRATLMASPLIKYQLYYIYLIIQEHENQRFDDVFKKVIQLAHQEWETQLPNYVDRAQFESLIMFQQVVESSEGGRSMIREARHLGGNERLKELKAAMNIWRERIPHQCESIKTWKEVLENRNFIYEQLCHFIQPQLNNVNIVDNQLGQRADGVQVGVGALPPQPQVELLDICWNLVKLASVSRKHGLPSLALYYQDAAEKKLSISPIGHNDSLRYERYKHQLEVLKLELSHNTEEPDGLESKLRNHYQRLTVEPSYEPWQRATFRRVIADYYLDQGRLRNAQDHLMIAISELNRRDPKLWMSYARLNETIFERKRDEQSFINSIKGLLFATTLSLHKSRLIMPKILRLFRQKEHQNNNIITEYIKENTDHMPTWIWIFWAPQLLVMLQQPERQMEHLIGRHILGKLVTLYPQAAYYPLRANFTFCSGQAPGALRDLLRRLKQRDPDVLHDIEMIGKEFNENVKPRPEESLCAWLQGLEIATFFNRQDVQGSVQNFLKKLYDNYLHIEARSASPLLRALAPGYEADFLNEETRETCILKSLLRLKNLKDFLLYTINSREQSTHLEELSPCLAHFNRRAIEIPGQHVLSESEPLPQRTVYLDRFEAFVQRSGLTQRKIVFKGSNSKSYPFSATPATDYSRICSEERATQLKVLMNMIFQRHKETLRRGIKFCVPSKLIMYLSKLSQDDLTFQEFQETHDFLLQEKGVDPDIALLLQIKWVRQLLDNAPLGQTRSLSQITSEEIKQLNISYFQAMVGNNENPDLCQDSCLVPSTLLSSYFHRIFYNVDDLFLFKKRFTTYHAANSFFTYAFNQAEFQNLNSMSFCKSTGRLTFSEPRLKSCHKSPQVFLNKTLEEVEIADFDQESRYMPFRLTSNIVDFIGTIGLQGLFAGVMTSCSLAISQSPEKLHYFLNLVLKDELFVQPGEEEIDQVAEMSANYTIFKIKSLSNHSKVIDLPRTAADRLAEEELDENNPNQWIQIGQTQVPAYMMDLQMTKPDMPEEFNKKVFKLMELSLEDSRRRQMLTMWCPWF